LLASREMGWVGRARMGADPGRSPTARLVSSGRPVSGLSSGPLRSRLHPLPAHCAVGAGFSGRCGLDSTTVAGAAPDSDRLPVLPASRPGSPVGACTVGVGDVGVKILGGDERAAQMSLQRWPFVAQDSSGHSGRRARAYGSGGERTRSGPARRELVAIPDVHDRLWVQDRYGIGDSKARSWTGNGQSSWGRLPRLRLGNASVFRCTSVA
jgi:hypothetical protein